MRRGGVTAALSDYWWTFFGRMASCRLLCGRTRFTSKRVRSALPGEAVEFFQRLGVRESAGRRRLLDGRACEDPLHRHLELLGAERARHRTDLVDLVGHVPRRQRGAQLARDPRAQ